MSRVLVVEDNVTLALGLRHSLESEGHGVEVVHDGASALARVREGSPDLIVLDLMLPGIDGFTLLRELRGQGLVTPVLILSARGEEVDKIQGFRLGADDYVVKPVGLVELLLRVGAILRRSGAQHAGTHGALHTVGAVTIDLGARVVRHGEDVVQMTRLEFDLLACLIRNRGQAITRAELLSEVWGFPEPDRVRTRTIDTHIATLRSKVEHDPAHPTVIQTVRKVGYRLAED